MFLTWASMARSYGLEGVPVDGVEQLGAGQDATRVAREGLDQGELARGQVDDDARLA